jgi:hypothetical protein
LITNAQVKSFKEATKFPPMTSRSHALDDWIASVGTSKAWHVPGNKRDAYRTSNVVTTGRWSLGMTPLLSRVS